MGQFFVLPSTNIPNPIMSIPDNIKLINNNIEINNDGDKTTNKDENNKNREEKQQNKNDYALLSKKPKILLDDNNKYICPGCRESFEKNCM